MRSPEPEQREWCRVKAATPTVSSPPPPSSFLPCPPGNGCSVQCLSPCGTGAEVTAALGSGLPREQGPRLWASCCLTTSRSRALPDLVALGEMLHPSPVFSPVTAEGQGHLVERTPVMHTRHSLDLAHPGGPVLSSSLCPSLTVSERCRGQMCPGVSWPAYPIALRPHGSRVPGGEVRSGGRDTGKRWPRRRHSVASALAPAFKR